MTAEVELKEIKSLLVDLAKRVEWMNDLIEERLIGSVEPLSDEVEAAKEYEAAKKNGALEFVSWKNSFKEA